MQDVTLRESSRSQRTCAFNENSHRRRSRSHPSGRFLDCSEQQDNSTAAQKPIEPIEPNNWQCPCMGLCGSFYEHVVLGDGHDVLLDAVHERLDQRAPENWVLPRQVCDRPAASTRTPLEGPLEAGSRMSQRLARGSSYTRRSARCSRCVQCWRPAPPAKIIINGLVIRKTCSENRASSQLVGSVLHAGRENT